MYLCGTIAGDTSAETIYTGMLIPPELMRPQELKSNEQVISEIK